LVVVADRNGHRGRINSHHDAPQSWSQQVSKRFDVFAAPGLDHAMAGLTAAARVRKRRFPTRGAPGSDTRPCPTDVALRCLAAVLVGLGATEAVSGSVLVRSEEWTAPSLLVSQPVAELQTGDAEGFGELVWSDLVQGSVVEQSRANLTRPRIAIDPSALRRGSSDRSGGSYTRLARAVDRRRLGRSGIIAVWPPPQIQLYSWRRTR
jgi:hypothetical protein